MKKNKYYILIYILIVFIVAIFNIQCSIPTPAITEKTSVGTTMSATTSTTAVTSSKLSMDSLKNLEYKIEYTQSGVAKLTNGEYQEEAAPGSATKIIIKLSEYVSFGDLNNDKAEDAAVILISEPGGSGTFYDLAAVLNKEGNLESTNSIFLGDRIKIKTISIDSGVITVHYLDRKEEQSMAEEPTVDKTQKFIVENGILSLDTKVSATTAITIENINNIKTLVEDFGKVLVNVSLLSPPINLENDMKKYYSPFISEELLSKWLKDPSKALGRLYSSPWPDHIEIINVKKITAEKYEISGNVVEITSQEEVNGGYFDKYQINLTIEKINNLWLITDVSKDLSDSNSKS